MEKHRFIGLFQLASRADPHLGGSSAGRILSWEDRQPGGTSARRILSWGDPQLGGSSASQPAPTLLQILVY